MRQKRSKTYRKLLSSYILHFNFRPPFQLLIDASFAHSLAALHLSPQQADARLSDVLQTSQLSKGKTRVGNPEMKCMITQCSMVQLYQAEKLGNIEKDAVTIAKSWERRRCNHLEAIDANECLKEVIGPNNKHRYLLASDSKKLREYLREEVAGLPLVHTNQSRVIVLEPMSEKTKARVEELEHAKLQGHQLMNVSQLGTNVVTETNGGSPSTSLLPSSSSSSSSKKRKIREANPLSNKKPKKVLEAEKAQRERRTREIAERTEMKRRQAAEAAATAATAVAEGSQRRTSEEESVIQVEDSKADDLVAVKSSREDTTDDVDGQVSQKPIITAHTSSQGEGEGEGRKKKRKRGSRGSGAKSSQKNDVKG